MNGDIPRILLSFLGDVYQPAEMELGLTRETIKIPIQNRLPFTILTKGGTRAVRVFDLLESYGRSRFGTSLVFMDQEYTDYWEPGAASIRDRIEAISRRRTTVESQHGHLLNR
jgi:DNA repair photolyase